MPFGRIISTAPPASFRKRECVTRSRNNLDTFSRMKLAAREMSRFAGFEVTMYEISCHDCNGRFRENVRICITFLHGKNAVDVSQTATIGRR